MCEAKKAPLRVGFGRKLKLEFHGAKLTEDAGLLLYRELDGALVVMPLKAADRGRN